VIDVAPRATFDIAARARARKLFDAGKSCNAIAKAVGFAPSTISRWAKKEGLRFDREQTSMANRAHTIDLEAARLKSAQIMMVNGFDAAAALDGPFLVYNFGGKDNTYAEHILDSPPIEARDKVQKILGQQVVAASRILDKDNGGLENTLGVLDALAGNLQAASELLRPPEETSTDGA
jgi:hypothetical protein